MHHLEIEQLALQLKYRYNPAPSCVQRVSKLFAKASNKYLSRDQVRTFEVTQRNLIFLPGNQYFTYRNGQAGSWRDSTQLVLKFNINEIQDEMFRDMVGDLLHWIRGSIDSWHSRQGDETPKKEGDAIVRFWVCSMYAYNQFKPVVNELWELTANNVDSGIHFGERARIKVMYYEREDHKQFPSKACIAESKVLEVWTEATEWQPDDSAIKLAREAFSRLWYMDLEYETDWWRLRYLGEGKAGDSDSLEEESSGEDDASEGVLWRGWRFGRLVRWSRRTEHRSFGFLDERQSVEREGHARMQKAHMYCDCDAINQDSAHQARVHHDSKEEAYEEREDDKTLVSL